MSREAGRGQAVVLLQRVKYRSGQDTSSEGSLKAAIETHGCMTFLRIRSLPVP
jgi:hypothetical protein